MVAWEQSGAGSPSIDPSALEYYICQVSRIWELYKFGESGKKEETGHADSLWSWSESESN